MACLRADRGALHRPPAAYRPSPIAHRPSHPPPPPAGRAVSANPPARRRAGRGAGVARGADVSRPASADLLRRCVQRGRNSPERCVEAPECKPDDISAVRDRILHLRDRSEVRRQVRCEGRWVRGEDVTAPLTPPHSHRPTHTAPLTLPPPPPPPRPPPAAHLVQVGIDGLLPPATIVHEALDQRGNVVARRWRSPRRRRRRRRRAPLLLQVLLLLLQLVPGRGEGEGGGVSG